MSSSSASRSPSLIACATRLDKILFSCADIRLLLPDTLTPTDYKHTVHDATRRRPVHLDAIPQSRGPRGGEGQIAVKVMAPDGSRPVPIDGEPSKLDLTALVDTREFGREASAKGVHMPRSTEARYTQEFKAKAVQLARSSPERSIRQLAYELGISDQTLRNWIR